MQLVWHNVHLLKILCFAEIQTQGSNKVQVNALALSYQGPENLSGTVKYKLIWDLTSHSTAMVT